MSICIVLWYRLRLSGRVKDSPDAGIGDLVQELDAIPDPELSIDAGNVSLHGTNRYPEFLGHKAVGLSGGHMHDDLPFTSGDVMLSEKVGQVRHLSRLN